MQSTKPTSNEAENGNKSKPLLAEDADSFAIYPFENAPNEEKENVIKGFMELTAKHALQIYKSLGLQVGFEGMIIEDTTGEEFIFSFKKRM
jgi:hypothetical protein